MVTKNISISVDKKDIDYCIEKVINKSKLFRKAVQSHREDK